MNILCIHDVYHSSDILKLKSLTSENLLSFLSQNVAQNYSDFANPVEYAVLISNLKTIVSKVV